MNAIVEVATAEVVAKTDHVVVFTTAPVSVKVVTTKVATSTKRVLSIAGTSISAVAPDYNFMEGTALAAA